MDYGASNAGPFKYPPRTSFHPSLSLRPAQWQGDAMGPANPANGASFLPTSFASSSTDSESALAQRSPRVENSVPVSRITGLSSTTAATNVSTTAIVPYDVIPNSNLISRNESSSSILFPPHPHSFQESRIEPGPNPYTFARTGYQPRPTNANESFARISHGLPTDSTSHNSIIPEEQGPNQPLVSPHDSSSSSSRSSTSKTGMTPFSPGTKDEATGTTGTPSSPLTSPSSSRSVSPVASDKDLPPSFPPPPPPPPTPSSPLLLPTPHVATHSPGTEMGLDIGMGMETGMGAEMELWKRTRPSRACASNVSYVYPQDDGEGVANRLSPARESPKGTTSLQNGAGEGMEGVLPPGEEATNPGTGDKRAKGANAKGKPKVKKAKVKPPESESGPSEGKKRKEIMSEEGESSKRKLGPPAPSTKRRKYANPTESITGTALTRSVGLCPSPNGTSVVPLPGMSIYNLDGTMQGSLAVDVLDLREMVVRMGKLEETVGRMGQERVEILDALQEMRERMSGRR